MEFKSTKPHHSPGRALFRRRMMMKKRQDDTDHDQSAVDGDHDVQTTQTSISGGGNGGGGFTLSAPITITITRTLDTVTSSSDLTSTTTDSATTTTSSSTALETIPTSGQLETSISSTTKSASLTAQATSSTSSGIGSSSLQNMDSNEKSHSGGLPAGGIAGIVIAIVFILAVVILFLFRIKAKNNQRKRVSLWAQTKVMDVEPANSSVNNTTAVEGEALGNTNVERKPAQTVVVPPMTYNNIPMSSTVDGIPAVPIYSPGTRPPSATSSTIAKGIPSSIATVVYSFLPSLPDELGIKVGESLRILAEYDDGWALCTNLTTGSGEQGMVPLECLDRTVRAGGLAASNSSPTSTEFFPSPVNTRGSHRISSLQARQ